jgi:hypothetical protein
MTIHVVMTGCIDVNTSETAHKKTPHVTAGSFVLGYVSRDIRHAS